MSSLLTSFYFNVSISGEANNEDSAFQEVSGLSLEAGIEEVVSGGENRFKYRLPTTTTYPNLVLKRGIASDSSPLIKWCKDTLNSGGKAIETKNILINLLNAEAKPSMGWNFVKAYPIKWSGSDLKSQESSILIETIEFSYQYFTVDDSRSNK